METKPNELYLFFDSNTWQGKKTSAYALAQAPHVKLVELDKEKLTPRLWAQIVKGMPQSAAELLEMEEDKMDGNDWFTYLNKNQTQVKHPIAMRGKKSIVCINPVDVLSV